MKAAGKMYEPVTYEGAGHGFMRAGEDPTNTVPGNKTAREQGFERLVKLLHEMKPVMASAAAGGVNTDAKAEGKASICHTTPAS
jgi:carboxymethylenebutenolidase